MLVPPHALPTQVIDLAAKVECFRTFGKIPLLVTQLLMCVHTVKRPVYLTRAGHFDQAEGLEPLRRRALTTLAQINRGGSFGGLGSVGDSADGAAGALLANAAAAAAAADGADSGDEGSVGFRRDSTAGPYAAAAEIDVGGGGSGSGEDFSVDQGAVGERHRVVNLSNAEVFMPAAATSAAELSDWGLEFSKRMAAFLEAQTHGAAAVVPLTSTLPRAVQTAAVLPTAPDEWSALVPLDTGICHGMKVKRVRAELRVSICHRRHSRPCPHALIQPVSTRFSCLVLTSLPVFVDLLARLSACLSQAAEVRESLPREYAEWQRDPFRYRFPGGESLVDVNRRLSELVLEVERLREPVLVVTHMAPVQSLVAYFLGTDMREAQSLKVPRHSLVKLLPSNYGWQMSVITEDELPPPIRTRIEDKEADDMSFFIQDRCG